MSGRDVCRSKKGTGVGAEEVDSRTRDPGNDSASTAPRSTEESLSEDVFTESELSPIREELLSSELRQEKSSDASLESVQTVSQMEVQSLAAKSESAHIPDHINSNTGPSSEQGPLSHETDLSSLELAAKEGAKAPEKVEEVSGPKEQSTNVKGHDRDSLRNGNALQEGGDGSVASAETVGLKEKQTVEKDGQGSESKRDSEAEVEELRQLWKTHSMQQAKQQRDSVQQVSQKESKHKSSPADGHVDGKCWGEVLGRGWRLSYCLLLSSDPSDQDCWVRPIVNDSWMLPEWRGTGDSSVQYLSTPDSPHFLWSVPTPYNALIAPCSF